MIRGINIWKEYFADYADNYVLIGGAACYLHEEEYAQVPRATKDLDLILIVEALTADFGLKFWDFINAGKYLSREYGKDKQEYYRFKNPEDDRFPQQVELFSRQVGKLNLPEEARLEPIHIEEGVSSLSAILMDDDYYNFTIEHSDMLEGIHLARMEALICLKARAYIDLLEKRMEGEQIDSRKVEKHKKDVFRLVSLLPGESSFELPDSLKECMKHFCDLVSTDLPNMDFMKSIGLRTMEANVLLISLKRFMDI